MNHEQRDFLNLVNLPARLTLMEAAWFLGFKEHDMPVLVAAGLLKPLGHPPSSGSKFFAAAELQTLRTDVRWLAKASDATVHYWKRKNSGRIHPRTETLQAA